MEVIGSRFNLFNTKIQLNLFTRSKYISKSAVFVSPFVFYIKFCFLFRLFTILPIIVHFSVGFTYFLFISNLSPFPKEIPALKRIKDFKFENKINKKHHAHLNNVSY
jgi:hypothetical protein